MNALQADAEGRLQVASLPRPEPKPSEVLVEVAYAGVNFADVGARGALPGSEVAGRVAAVGDGVSALRVGDPVVGIRAAGGYAEYTVVPASFAAKLPAAIPLETAAASFMQGLTAYHLVHTVGRLAPGERLLVLAGAGGVGGMAIQWAKLHDAGQIIAVASSEEKRRHALRRGAGLAIGYEDISGLGDQAVDLALDSVGGDVFPRVIGALAIYGRVILYGQAAGPRASIDLGSLVGRCQTIAGFGITTTGLTSPERFAQGVSALLGALEAGRVAPAIERVYAWQDAEEAWRSLKARQSAGKLLLAFSAA